MYHARMRWKTLALPDAGLPAGLLYALAWTALQPTVQPYWALPYGLRFGALLLIAPRRWPWLIGLELLAAMILCRHAGVPADWTACLAGELPTLLTVALMLAMLRRAHLQASLRDPEDATRLLLSAVLVVAASTTVDASVRLLLHASAAPDSTLASLGQQMLGDYLGILLVTPLLIMLLRARPERKALAALLTDLLLVMLPALALFLLLSRHAAPQPQFARVLSLAPVLFFAFRHGWRGACLSMLIVSAAMAFVDLRDGHSPGAAGYLFLAVTGTGALMLGSAIDALRRSSERVAEQNAHLAAANQRLDQLARQLRQAARGTLQAEETQRRHMAAELHDELGQNLTAIQTHLKLAQSRLHEAGLDDIGQSINTILGHMRRALHRLLDDLRPAVLDEFGLLRALDEGPIRDLLDAAGIAYATDLHGDPRKLDEDTRTAIYRLVQESATNTVKHAAASRFRLRLRIGERHGLALALLDIRDDGVGLPARLPRGGRGLQGMRDRVLSLGGVFRLQPTGQGMHLRILLRGHQASADIPRPV
jgi:two-component system sensor histidine kinase UhpB